MNNILFYKESTIKNIIEEIKFLQNVLKKIESGESNWTLDDIKNFLEDKITTPLDQNSCGNFCLK